MKGLAKLLAVLSITLLSLSANAFVCKKIYNEQEIRVEALDSIVIINYNGKERIIDSVNVNAFITGAGFAIKFDNHFGCIRNVKLITSLISHNVREISFSSCSGGGTPDDICGFH